MVDNVQVLVIAGKHSIEGAVAHRDSRLLDMLNDVNTEFLRIDRVAIFRHIRGECVAQFDDVMIPKSTIDFVMLVEDVHEAPLRRQYSFVEKQTYRVFAALTEHEISGILNQRGPADSRLILSRQSQAFFPITEATISSRDHQKIFAGVVLVNRSKVSLIQIGKHPIKRSASVETGPTT